jgi:hypothetical protein
MSEERFKGVMLGLLEDDDGVQHVGISIGGTRCVLTLRGAFLLFEQLGDLLEAAGVLETDEEEDDYDFSERAGSAKCH